MNTSDMDRSRINMRRTSAGIPVDPSSDASVDSGQNSVALPLYCTKCGQAITVVCVLGSKSAVVQPETSIDCPSCAHAIPRSLRDSVIRVWAGHGAAPR
jgi:hypothetical protein